jgi:hypothetical protein
MMHENALTKEQNALAQTLLPVIQGFYLAGGTALALQIGHRRSVDFGLASPKAISPFNLERHLISKGFQIQQTFTATADEYSALIQETRITFFYFPFEIEHPLLWDKGKITLPTIKDLGAMKAYALGRRSKWKDYVDLYFILKFHLQLDHLIQRAKDIFSGHFNSKLFREQLCYFDDMDYSESVEYLGHAPSDQEVKAFLEETAVTI